MNRRRFLRTGGGAAGVLAAGALTGCDDLPLPKYRLALPIARAKGSFATPGGERADLISHLLSRCAFGPRPGDWERARAMAESEDEAAAAWLDEQLHPERIDDRVCDQRLRRYGCLRASEEALFDYRPEQLRRELGEAAILRAVLSRRQLYEVMVGFWSDHFNIDPSKEQCQWFKVADDREVIRKHALGNFRDMLRASALSPAMLWYLDNRANTKRGPEDRANENYARELMELHTLGVRGGYTQNDVMEVARCLTGWTIPEKRPFGKRKDVRFDAEAHDDGEKTVLGQVIPAGLGAGDLDRVLEIVGAHESTARFIATKLCRRFIADDPPASAVDKVAATFLAREGEIRPTLERLFATSEFREARGGKLKRPFRFVVSALRATDADVFVPTALVPFGAKRGGGDSIHEYLVRMGHEPFGYPTPDGYPDEAGPWSGTLLWRWNFASALAENRIRGAWIRPDELTRRAGGEEGLMAHLLGRTPTDSERRGTGESESGLAFLLACPAFQRC